MLAEFLFITQFYCFLLQQLMSFGYYGKIEELAFCVYIIPDILAMMLCSSYNHALRKG